MPRDSQDRNRLLPSGITRFVAGVAIAAAVLAAGLETLQVYQARYVFQANAKYYGQKEVELRTAIAESRESGPTCRYTQELQTDPSPARLAEMRQVADHYATLKRKYLLASSQPWKIVPPDEPTP